ncbi:DegT/DnrJ/EryC1/StrS family aminotransferase [Paraconexibacter sp. AEG42_29]|uniref:DegT/DnrJ/EryC1/StrS family aminotransferase n=1 Tax=Paraconexibacter sp. AEG42_29 TaxID=2997339 RepID=UPI00339D9BDE
MAAPAAGVPFLDLRAITAEHAAELQAALARVLASGHFILGPELERFERAWAARVDARHCVGVGSGLDALVLALWAAGIGPGDEVVVPAHTFVATWLAVTRCGATPVGADADPTTGLVDPDAVAAAITPRTRALLPVHLYGQTADLTRLQALADRHGLVLIDDAAQAHGAEHRGRPVGGLADATAWSFYPGKNLGALGDGGAVTTDDDALAGRLRMLRNYGSREKYVHELAGTNSRLDELQAAALTVKLGHLETANARRATVAARYRARLGDLPLAQTTWGTHVHHLFVVRHPARDALQAHLAGRGIQTLVHYPIPPHRQAAYAGAGGGPRFPVADALAREVLSLPIGPHLTAADADRVCDAVEAFLG